MNEKPQITQSIVETPGVHVSTAPTQMPPEVPISPEPKKSINRKVVIGTLAFLFLIILAAIIAVVNKPKSQEVIPVENTDITPTAFPKSLKTEKPVSWALYRNETIEFMYPGNWILLRDAKSYWLTDSQVGTPSLTFNDYCKGTILISSENPKTIIVIESLPSNNTAQNPCWAERELFTTTEDSHNVTITGQTISLPIGKYTWDNTSYSLMEKHAFVPQFTNKNTIQFSLLTPEDEKNITQDVFATILASFTFSNEYKAEVPTAWVTHSEKNNYYNFIYPALWGSVIRNLTEATTGNFGNSGKVLTIDFSRKSILAYPRDAHVVGLSHDFTTTNNTLQTEFRGDPDAPYGVVSEIYIGLSSACFKLNDPRRPFAGYIYINAPGLEISGTTLIVPFLSPLESERYTKTLETFVSSNSYCKSNSLAQGADAVASEEKRLIEELMTSQDLDAETIINRDIFLKIASESAVRIPR